MSLQDAINTGNPPALDWTDVRFKRLALDQRLYDSTNSQGTANQVLSKSAGNALVWANVNPAPILGDINNFTSFETASTVPPAPPTPPTVVVPGDTQEVMFTTFFDNTSNPSLFSWDITNTRIGFNRLGTFEVNVELNFNYVSGSDGSIEVLIASNVANLNGKIFNKSFTAPVLGGNPSEETFNIPFIIDQRLGANPWIEVYVTNHPNSSDNISFNNQTPTCRFTAILLRS